MASLDTIRRTRIEVTTSGIPEATTGLKGLANAQAGVAVASEKVVVANENVARKFDNLQRAVDPAFRSMQQLERVERTLAQAREQNLVSLDRSNALLALARERYNAASAANENFAKSTGASKAAVQNLGFQINDIATSLGSGSSPMQVLAQQGGQVFQVYQQSPSVFGDMARSIAGVLTPARLLVGGVAAIGLTAAIAYSRWSDQQRELSRSLVGTGREAGVTRSQLDEAAAAAARLGGASIGSARETVGALANTGRVDPRFLAPVAALQKDVSATLGIDAAEANTLLANSFARPIEGAEALNAKFGGLTDRTRSYIRTLVETGNEERARQVMLDTFVPRLGKAAELTSIWARAWESVKSATAGAMDNIGKSIDRTLAPPPATPTESRQGVIDALERTKADIELQARMQARIPEAAARWRDALVEVNRELEKARGILRETEVAQTNATRASEAAVTEGRRRSEQREDVERGTAVAQRQNQPEQAITDNLRQQIRDYEALRKAKESAYTRFREGTGTNQEYQDAIRNQQAALQALRPQFQSGGRNVFERGIAPGFRQDVDTEAGMNAILERRIPLVERLDRAEAVGRQTREAAVGTTGDRSRAAANESRFRDEQRGPAAGGPEVVARNAQIASNRVIEDSNRELRVSFRDRRLAQQDAIETQQRETAVMGGSIAQVEAARLQQQLLTDARREYRRAYGENAQVPAAELEFYTELARRMGAARQAQAELKLTRDIGFERDQMFRSPTEQVVASRTRDVFGDDYARHLNGNLASQARFNENLKQSIELSGDFAKGFVSDLIKGKSGMDALVGAAGRLGDRLVSMAMDQVIRQLFSGLGGIGLGSLGGGGNPGSAYAYGAGGYTGAGPYGYADGGYTGPGGKFEPAGIVHRGEYVFDAASTARIGVSNLSRLRGFADGGYVGSAPANDNRPAGGNVVINNMGAPVDAKQSRNSQGDLVIELMPKVEAAMAKSVSNRTGPLGGSISSTMNAPQSGGLRG